MKNLILILLVAISISFIGLKKNTISIQKTFTTNEENDSSYEFHKKGVFKNTHSINCVSTPSSDCFWDRIPETPIGNSNIIENEVYSLIKKDSVIGSFNRDKVTVSWKAIDSNNYEININW